MKNKLSNIAILGSLMALGSISTAFAVGPAGLTRQDAENIFQVCKAAADAEPSPIRGAGKFTKMWCAVVNREGTLLLDKATDTEEPPANVMTTDAWRVSIEVAPAKAFTAVSTSSNDAASTSEGVGLAAMLPPDNVGTLFGIGDTNPYRPLTGNKDLSPDDRVGRKHHGIVTFPGGVPVYTNPDNNCAGGDKGALIGAVGVSGDRVDADRNVAEKAVDNAGFCRNP